MESINYSEDSLNEFPDHVVSPGVSPAYKKPKQKSYRKKVETAWSHDKIIKLIEEVESRRSLWDVRLPEYKLQKDYLWQQVADIIPTTLNDCKGKWTNLRITFKSNVEKLRKKKLGQGADEGAPVVWKYFKKMMFLEVNKLRQSTHSTSSMQLECENDSLLSGVVSADEMSSQSPSMPVEQRKRRINTSSSLPSKNKRSNELKEMAVEALQSIHSKQLEPRNSCIVLGEYIAAELMSLTPEQATYAKAKLRRSFNDIMDEVALMNTTTARKQRCFISFNGDNQVKSK